MRDVTEGMSCYSPHLTKNNKHVGESLSCRLRVKGHGQGLRQLGVKEVILEGLLISQGLNLVKVVSVQSSTPLEVRHICLAQNAKSLRRVTESSKI